MHLALVECKNSDETSNVGFSFPSYHYNSVRHIGCIGDCIRLFPRERGDLLKFLASLDLSRIEKYLVVTTVKEISFEKITGYSMFLRKQDKVNAARLARRQVKDNLSLNMKICLKLMKTM